MSKLVNVSNMTVGTDLFTDKNDTKVSCHVPLPQYNSIYSQIFVISLAQNTHLDIAQIFFSFSYI